MIFAIQIEGESGRAYDVTQARDGSFFCECPAWRNKRGVDAKHRTCKHIDALTDALLIHRQVVQQAAQRVS